MTSTNDDFEGGVPSGPPLNDTELPKGAELENASPLNSPSTSDPAAPDPVGPLKESPSERVEAEGTPLDSHSLRDTPVPGEIATENSPAAKGVALQDSPLPEEKDNLTASRTHQDSWEWGRNEYPKEDGTELIPKNQEQPGASGGRPREKFQKGVKAFRTQIVNWFQASRPQFFIATIFPLFLGFFAAKNLGEVSIGTFVLILVASFLVHLAANIANDYFEHLAGVDRTDSLGGSRVIQEGKLTPLEIRNGIIVCYTVSFILALFIVRNNQPLWCLVAFAAFSSLFYVAPPIRYGHRALGELMVFLNMGVIMVVGTFMALTGTFLKGILVLSLPSSFMVANILYYQSLPEMEADKLAGKRTLANLLGKERAALVQLLWWPVVWLLVLILFLMDQVSGIALWGFLGIPLHVIACRRIAATENWEELDKSGYLVRLLYVVVSLFLVLGVAL
jgi:1,4-dihydroxy-2-naphthoate octaprenyltransferase